MQTDQERGGSKRRGHGSRVLGVALMATGVVLFVQQAGYLTRDHGWMWALIPAVFGLVHLSKPGHRSLGVWLLAWGLLLCADQLELVPLKRSWPLMVVAAGAGILVKGFDRRRPRFHHPEEN